MAKAPTIKEAIKMFEEKKGVVAAEVEKVQLLLGPHPRALLLPALPPLLLQWGPSGAGHGWEGGGAAHARTCARTRAPACRRWSCTARCRPLRRWTPGSQRSRPARKARRRAAGPGSCMRAHMRASAPVPCGPLQPALPCRRTAQLRGSLEHA